MTGVKRIFIDTAPFIYYLESSSLYFDKLMRFFTKCCIDGTEIVTSALTVEEYLAYPYSNNRVELVKNFEKFLSYMKIKVIPIDEEIAKQGAKLQARYQGFRGTDALQVAVAMKNDCDVFFTSDGELKREKELPCMTLEDLD